ncbi:MAG: hypothetical protein ACXV3D_09375, partial [Halobacteriota archaeon]
WSIFAANGRGEYVRHDGIEGSSSTVSARQIAKTDIRQIDFVCFLKNQIVTCLALCVHCGGNFEDVLGGSHARKAATVRATKSHHVCIVLSAI